MSVFRLTEEQHNAYKAKRARECAAVKPKSIDASRSRLRGAGVRLNARLARRALVRKIRDAQARDERSR